MHVKALSVYVVSQMYSATLASSACSGILPISYSLTFIGELWTWILQGILLCKAHANQHVKLESYCYGCSTCTRLRQSANVGNKL